MIFILPLIAALIGWLINKIAVSFIVRGLVKQQGVIANRLGELAEDQFSFDDIKTKLADPENIKNLIPLVESHLDSFLRERLPKAMPVLSMFIGDTIVNQIKSHLVNELDALFPVLINQYINNVEKELDIKKMISSRINNIPSATLQSTVREGLKPQFRQLELLGAISGFITGLVTLAACALLHC